MSNRPQDRIYSDILAEIADFSFDEAVARVFPDMIQRSVPGYSTIINMIGILAAQHAQAHSHCYDLGCSLGAASLSMRHRITQPGCTIVAVDNAQAMVERCRQNLSSDYGELPVEVICDDVRNIVIENASVVVLNFTLQFISPADRAELLGRIYSGLLPGGCLILSEKISFDDATAAAFHTHMHYAFKKANGYSDLEISQKRTALEKVLLPDSVDQHFGRLRQSGFAQMYTWYQCLNFASMIAIK